MDKAQKQELSWIRIVTLFNYSKCEKKRELLMKDTTAFFV